MARMEPGATLPVRPVLAVPAAGMARYLAIWACVLCLLLGAIIGFCAAIDPYAVIGTPLIAGVNRDKPAASNWPRVTKAYTVQRSHAATLILGNSSADVGFDPDSAAWPAASRPVFNLAIDGGLPAVHLRYLQHALSAIQPTRLLVAVNFTESMVTPPRRLSAAAQDQFAFEPRMRILPDGASNPGYVRAHFADLLFSTLSFDAVADSIATIADQNDPGATYETAAGWNNGGKFRRWARDDGFNSLFITKDREKTPQYAKWAGHQRLDIASVGQIVSLARAHGIETAIVILPNHSDQMETLRQLGLDDAYDAWKRDVVRAAATADPRAVIWDFSGYSLYTTEPVPPPGDHTTRLRWFWEPVHFQSPLGDLMVARMNGAAEPAGFGVRLTQETLPAHIAAFHAAEKAWAAAHPADVARLRDIVAASR